MHRLNTHAKKELENIKRYVKERLESKVPPNELETLMKYIEQDFLKVYLKYGPINYLTI